VWLDAGELLHGLWAVVRDDDAVADYWVNVAGARV
jgi:hypothetical protein